MKVADLVLSLCSEPLADCAGFHPSALLLEVTPGSDPMQYKCWGLSKQHANSHWWHFRLKKSNGLSGNSQCMLKRSSEKTSPSSFHLPLSTSRFCFLCIPPPQPPTAIGCQQAAYKDRWGCLPRHVATVHVSCLRETRRAGRLHFRP